ncbi:MAG: hypothetical protein LH478_15515 [Chitinophagaceae bacterium]|nr:hypothetical protein [Chitinophagaceae bacterium]
MKLVIDFETINDVSKKQWLIDTLRLMNISFNTTERRQTIEEYNLEIDEAEKEIERGEYTTAADLKKEARLW